MGTQPYESYSTPSQQSSGHFGIAEMGVGGRMVWRVSCSFCYTVPRLLTAEFSSFLVLKTSSSLAGLWRPARMSEDMRSIPYSADFLHDFARFLPQISIIPVIDGGKLSLGDFNHPGSHIPTISTKKTIPRLCFRLPSVRREREESVGRPAWTAVKR